MKKLLTMAACAALCLFSAAAQAKITGMPALSAEEVIALAKGYVKEHQLGGDNHFIGNVQYVCVDPQSEVEKCYWRVTYRLNRQVKGGMIFVDIHDAKNISVSYGE